MSLKREAAQQNTGKKIWKRHQNIRPCVGCILASDKNYCSQKQRDKQAWQARSKLKLPLLVKLWICLIILLNLERTSFKLLLFWWSSALVQEKKLLGQEEVHNQHLMTDKLALAALGIDNFNGKTTGRIRWTFSPEKETIDCLAHHR